MAIELTCNMCGKAGDDLTEECYKGTLIGPEFEKGLVVGTKFKGFYIFYGELEPEGHKRKYHFEKVDVIEGCLLPWGESFLKLSMLDSWKNEMTLGKASENEVSFLRNALENNVRGSGVIKSTMKREGIKELHNRTDYFN